MRRTPLNVCSVFHELESRTESKGESGAAEDPSWVPRTHNWQGSFQPLLMLTLGDPTEASVIMHAFPHAVTRHMQNCNERNCQRRKWAEQGHYCSLFLGCGGNVTSCHKLPPACLFNNECLYPPTVSPNNPLSPSAGSVRLSGHSNQKSSSYRKPVAGHASPGGKLIFRVSFL